MLCRVIVAVHTVRVLFSPLTTSPGLPGVQGKVCEASGGRSSLYRSWRLYSEMPLSFYEHAEGRGNSVKVVTAKGAGSFYNSEIHSIDCQRHQVWGSASEVRPGKKMRTCTGLFQSEGPGTYTLYAIGRHALFSTSARQGQSGEEGRPELTRLGGPGPIMSGLGSTLTVVVAIATLPIVPSMTSPGLARTSRRCLLQLLQD